MARAVARPQSCANAFLQSSMDIKGIWDYVLFVPRSPGDPKGRSVAGAVSAAVREVRPLEIVGLYESQQEALEVSCTTNNFGRVDSSSLSAKL